MDCAAINRHIVHAATASDDGDSLLASVCTMMLEAGIPVWRVSATMPALDVMARGITLTWTCDAGVALSMTAHSDGPQAFLESPIRALLDQEMAFGRWQLAALPESEPFPVLHEFKAQGGTDYVLHMVRFTPGTALLGVALSFATRSPGGFNTDHLTAIADLVPVLGLAIAKFSLAHTLRRTLATYLGSATSEQVLGGRIVRGEGRTIWAAILLVDLRDFTALTDRSDPGDVVAWVNEHLEALGSPVLDNGGEILKFLGDGFLAVFPVASPDASPCLDCEKALAAAVAARAANQALNRQRGARDLPVLHADVVLHFGEVVYGNVGTEERLDFTIIGRAVNEASRIEKSCGALDRSILISDSFAKRCRDPLADVGVVPLRGLDRNHQVWTVPEEPDQSSAAQVSALDHRAV